MSSCDEDIIDNSTSSILKEESIVTEIVTVDEVTYIIEASSETIIEKSNNTEIVEKCEQGPPGKQGIPGSVGEFQFSTDVNPGETLSLDDVDILTVRAAKWIVVIEDNINNLFQYFDFSAIHNGSTARDTWSSKKGDKFDYSIDASVSSGFMQLIFTNNSLTTMLTVKTVRINVNI